MSSSHNRNTKTTNLTLIGTGEAENITISTRASMTVNVTITRDIYCKPAKDQTKSVLSSARWHVASMTLSALITHILNGFAYNVSVFKTTGKRHDQRLTNFAYSHLIGVDIDGGNYALADLLNIPFIRDYAVLVHSTPSSTNEAMRWRVLWALETPIDDGVRYADYVTRVHALLLATMPELDTSTKDASRLFYGNDLTPRGKSEHKAYHQNTSARLPISALDCLPQAQYTAHKPTGKKSARVEIPMSAQTSEAVNADIESLIDGLNAKLKKMVRDLMVTAKGNQNNAMYRVARAMNDRNLPIERAYTILRFCALKMGYTNDDGTLATDSIEATLKSAYGNIPTPSVTKDDDDIAHLNALACDDVFATGDNVMTVNYRYLTMMSAAELDRVLSKRVVMIKSPTGTGKTTLQKTIIQRLSARGANKTLIVTHRRRLVNEIARSHGFLTYADYRDNPTIPIGAGVVTTADSLHLFAHETFDTVFIDENVLHHITHAKTLREKHSALRALELVTMSAKRVFISDANFDSVTGLIFERWLSQSAGDTLRVVNTHRPQNRPLSLWRDRSGFIAHVFETAKKGFTALACASKREARIIGEMARITGLRVCEISSFTQNGEMVQEVLNDLNNADIDLLIYTSIIGTGVDITRQCAGAFLLAGAHLSADEHIQLLSRCRNASEYGACGIYTPSVGDAGNGDILPADSASTIYDDILTNTVRTFGTTKLDTYKLMSAQFYSEIESALRTHHADKWRFHRLALANGFTFTRQHTVENAHIASLYKATAKADKERVNTLIETITPINDEVYQDLATKGAVTLEIYCANTRHKIEVMTAMGITPEHREMLDTAEKRARVYRLADWLAGRGDVVRLDGIWNAEKAYQDITPRTLQKDLFTVAMATIGVRHVDDLRDIQDMSADELITDGFIAFLNAHADELRRRFNRRMTDNPITELRWLLRQFGVKVTSRQIKRDNVRFMVYSVDCDHLDKVLSIALRLSSEYAQKTGIRANSQKLGRVHTHTQSDDTARGEGRFTRPKNPFSVTTGAV